MKNKIRNVSLQAFLNWYLVGFATNIVQQVS